MPKFDSISVKSRRSSGVVLRSMRRLFLRGDGGAQFVRRLALDVAHHRHDQPAGRVDGDREVDVREQNARLLAASYQAFNAGSARQALIMARISRSM